MNADTNPTLPRLFSSVELCAGGGGQALGLEAAGFEHVALVERDAHACATLRQNRPKWNVIERRLEEFDARPFAGVDLVAGGVPCPPFSKAGKQLGAGDERNLFPEALRVVAECRPRAILLENVRGLLDPVFAEYRQWLGGQLADLGYTAQWRLLNASDFGVPQLRPRVVMVGLPTRALASHPFAWPTPSPHPPPTVGEALLAMMSARQWSGAATWARGAASIAPTVVGGSHKHGGPDLGPTRAKRAWAALGVDGMGIADSPPPPDFIGMPRLTVAMVAQLQGFSPEWRFAGRKTHAYRQVGNAFPPPVARAVASSVATWLDACPAPRARTGA
ncbi:MAG: DNA (cytosine-5-)-methyltransferase [Deltaproteobacteria bacterium]|nr:DNA (cytosine-5-)-methyltransferase [Deltaproteobacteria bacterium]